MVYKNKKLSFLIKMKVLLKGFDFKFGFKTETKMPNKQKTIHDSDKMI